MRVNKREVQKKDCKRKMNAIRFREKQTRRLLQRQSEKKLDSVFLLRRFASKRHKSPPDFIVKIACAKTLQAAAPVSTMFGRK